jgi:opacity protein-like surface antigen
LGVALAASSVGAPARASEERGVELAFRLGYGIPFGNIGTADGETLVLNDLVTGQIPLWFDLGYRITPSVVVGAYFAYGVGITPDSTCPSGVSCSTDAFHLGVEGQYRFLPRERADPWVGLGVGYEWLSTSTVFSENVAGTQLDAVASFALRGWEFLRLQGGVDFAVRRAFAVGPFVDVSLGEYTTSSSMSAREIPDKAIHGWVTLGVRAVFDP